MKQTWEVISAISAILASANLFATANAPIQRIDLANILGNSGGVTQTSVLVAFANGSTAPCYTTTVPFQGVITVWAGIGQNCVTAITDITITPLSEPGGMSTNYEAPGDFIINGSFYSTQVVISQNTPPVFDPDNGALLTLGTVQLSIINNVTHNR